MKGAGASREVPSKLLVLGRSELATRQTFLGTMGGSMQAIGKPMGETMLVGKARRLSNKTQ